MQRALALFALSVFVSVTLTAVTALLARPETRRAAFDVASRCRPAKSAKEVLP
jgi:hypothetical protein